MNIIVIIDSLTRTRTKEEYADGMMFTDRINEIMTRGNMIYYGKNDIGGVSAIIEV